MKLKFTETGRVEGGIECSYKTWRNLHHSKEGEIVFDLPKWINRQFSELHTLVKNDGTRGLKLSRLVWIGATENPFALLTSSISIFSAKYYHPKYIKEQVGMLALRETFESTDMEEVTEDIIVKALRVANLEG